MSYPELRLLSGFTGAPAQKAGVGMGGFQSDTLSFSLDSQWMIFPLKKGVSESIAVQSLLHV